MSSSYILLANLRAGSCSNTAEVRLLRFWEARNIKNGELLSLDLLLLDEQSTLVHATIGSTLAPVFQGRLRELAVYSLSAFDVSRSNLKWRLSDSPVSVRFNDATIFEVKTELEKKITNEFFRFQSHEKILALANTNKHLSHVIGELSAIRSTITDGLDGPQRVMVNLCIEGGVKVCVSLFDNRAAQFQAKFDSYGSEPKIILFTGINPRMVGGRLFLNNTFAIVFYFDGETSAGEQLLTRLTPGSDGAIASSSKVVPAQKIEPLTVAELNQFVLSAEPQNITFLCKAAITSFQSDKGWCYIGCSKCSRKLQRTDSSFTCVFCDREDAMGVLRYRVEFCVADETADAVFVSFDKEIAKLTHIMAAEAAQILGTGVNAKVDSKFPPFLNELVGKTFTFQLKLGEFNFTSKHQTFTVSRIIAEHERTPLPTFADGGNDHGPDGNGGGGGGEAGSCGNVKKKAHME